MLMTLGETTNSCPKDACLGRYNDLAAFPPESLADQAFTFAGAVAGRGIIKVDSRIQGFQ